MIISATGNTKEYEPCPEYNGKAVCVDVSPLKEYDTEYGKKMKFKFVFEIDLLDTTRDPVRSWVVLTKPMVASLHEKAALTKFLKDWFGRHLSDVFSAFRLLRYLLPRHRNPLMGNGARRIGDGTQFFHYRDRGGSEAFRLGEVVLIVFRSLC